MGIERYFWAFLGTFWPIIITYLAYSCSFVILRSFHWAFFVLKFICIDYVPILGMKETNAIHLKKNIWFLVNSSSTLCSRTSRKYNYLYSTTKKIGKWDYYCQFPPFSTTPAILCYQYLELSLLSPNGNAQMLIINSTPWIFVIQAPFQRTLSNSNEHQWLENTVS